MPDLLADFRGQPRIKEILRLIINKHQSAGTSMSHVLLDGPAGHGKTTLAGIIAAEFNATPQIIHGPAVRDPQELLRTFMTGSRFIFIDEIHALKLRFQETIYSAMEEFRVPWRRGVMINIKPFTLIGATTEIGKLAAPLRSRFGLTLSYDEYSWGDLEDIAWDASDRLDKVLADAGVSEVVMRCKGTPRKIKQLVQLIHDMSSSNRPSVEDLQNLFKLLGISTDGLDTDDTIYLTTLEDKFNGGPAGLHSLASLIGKDSKYVAEEMEPYLMKMGYVERTPRGRAIGKNWKRAYSETEGTSTLRPVREGESYPQTLQGHETVRSSD